MLFHGKAGFSNDFFLFIIQIMYGVCFYFFCGGMQSERLIHATASHGYLLTVDIAPEHEMEKVLYAVDELTGLIGAVALMRPSKSTLDLELKSVKKKYKALNFAAGCSREVIQRGADMLGWTLDDLISDTILAMRTLEKPQAE